MRVRVNTWWTGASILVLGFVLVGVFQNCSGFSSLTSGSRAGTSSASSLFTSSSSAQCPAGWVCPVNPILPPTTVVGAWFTVYWHTPNGKPTGTHWDAWTRYDPVDGRYSSGDPVVLKREFSRLRAAGVDYLLLDDTNGITNDDGLIDQNVQSVFATAKSLPAADRPALALALGAAENRQTLAQATVEVDYAAQLATRYAGTYFLWKRKPLVVQYGPYDVADAVPAALRQWRDDRFTFGYALHHVDVTNPLVRAYTEGLWGWVTSEPKLASVETIAVSPGYERAHFDHVSPTVAREGGARYMREWLFAVKQKPRNIVIASWNDFGEETQVAPSVPSNNAAFTPAPPWTDAYGDPAPDWYLQITAAYSNLRTGLQVGSFYRDEDNAAVYQIVNGAFVYQAALPHGHPVIYLPAGTLAGLGAVAPTVATTPTVTPVVTPPVTSTPVVTVPDPVTSVYRLRDGTGDYLMTTSLDESRDALGLGFTYEGVGFELFQASSPPRHTIYRCFSTATGHFLSRVESCEGFGKESVLGYSERTPTAGAGVHVQRCYNPQINRHVATVNVGTECTAQTGFTLESDSDLGYVLR